MLSQGTYNMYKLHVYNNKYFIHKYHTFYSEV